VDEISQKYAIQMQHATSVEKLQSLTESLVAEFCDMIYDQRHSSYSYEVKKALQTIELNLGQPLSTARLAALSGVSSNYFGKKFCRETGMTVKQYITKRRCEVSARLLTDSKISIQEIAAYVGFPDASYFARVFKKENGVSPQAFRNSANFL
jgi:AraC-like DNA-binding protein